MPPAVVPTVDGHAPPSIHVERLASCVATLDPASRALLDLSLRHRIRDEAMAPILRIDPFNLAWRRARAIERIATQLGLSDPAGIGAVRGALTHLPERAWLAAGPAVEADPPAVSAPKPPPVVAIAPRPAVPPPAPVRPALSAAPTAAIRAPSGLRAVVIAGAGALLGVVLSRRRRRR